MGKKFNSVRDWCAAVSAALLMFAVAPATQAGSLSGALQVAQSDCYAIGQQVCVIVVLVPGKNGERPRRTEVVVPAN